MRFPAFSRNRDHAPARHLKDSPGSVKWLLTCLLAAAAFLDPISYTLLYPALSQLPSSLATTQELANLAGTLSLIGPAIAPLYWSLIAEEYGRRIVLLSSLSLFAVFSVVAGIAKSIGVLIAMRVLASFCSCAVPVAGAAVVADIWASDIRGLAMSIFYLGPLTGPALGPVIGGVLAQVWNWRATQWFLSGYSATVVLALAFSLKETLEKGEQSHPSTDSGSEQEENESSPRGRWATAASVLFHYLLLPLSTVKYLRFAAIICVIFVASVCFAAVIVSATTAQQLLHEGSYGLPYILVGVCYLSFALGLIMGGLLSGTWSDKIAARQAKKLARYNPNGQLFFAPEGRIGENAWIAVGLLPLSLLTYGWTLDANVNLAGPLVGWFMIGFSTGMIFGLATTLLTELVPHKSASLVALNALGRNAFAAVGGSITEPLSAAMGVGWFYTGMAVFVALNILAIGLFVFYGRVWRESIERTLQLQTAVLDQGEKPSLLDQDQEVAAGPFTAGIQVTPKAG